MPKTGYYGTLGVAPMKKTVFLCIIILVSSFCYSQESEWVGVEFWGGMPFIGGSLDRAGNETIKTEAPFSFGIGVAAYNIFRDSNVGLVGLINYVFPEALLHTIEGKEIRYAWKDMLSLDVQLGVGYHVLGQDGVFRLPVTFDLHFFNFDGSLEITNETYSLNIGSIGFGASVAAELHLDLTYFFFRLQGFFDFIYDASISHIEYIGYNLSGGRRAYFIDSRKFTTFSTFLGITPSIGWGLKLNAGAY